MRRNNELRRFRRIAQGTLLVVIFAGASSVTLTAIAQDGSEGPSSGEGGQPYDLSWHTMDSGGEAVSTGDNFEFSGTVGQPDAGTLTEGTYTFIGGFWFSCVAGDGDCDSDIDLNDFEEFRRCLAGPNGGLPEPQCASFDSDDSGNVSLREYAAFQESFSG